MESIPVELRRSTNPVFETIVRIKIKKRIYGVGQSSFRKVEIKVLYMS